MPRKPIPPEMMIHGRPPQPRRNAKGDRMLTVAHFFDASASSVLPMIRIRGRWLEQLGFDRGERVAMSVKPKRIVLTLVDEES
jgi:toxic protein SymE